MSHHHYDKDNLIRLQYIYWIRWFIYFLWVLCCFFWVSIRVFARVRQKRTTSWDKFCMFGDSFVLISFKKVVMPEKRDFIAMIKLTYVTYPLQSFKKMCPFYYYYYTILLFFTLILNSGTKRVSFKVTRVKMKQIVNKINKLYIELHLATPYRHTYSRDDTQGQTKQIRLQ